jgi:hypothetical protein
LGLIYSSSDSTQLMNALKENLQSGKEACEQLKAGSQKVIAAVDGKTLSGAAYTAGKGLFSDLINPTISKVTSAIDCIENDLQTYTEANNAVSSEGTLDEDKLTQQIATKKAMKASVDVTATVAKSLINNNPVAKVLDGLLNVQTTLNRMSNEYEQDIQALEKKLEKLRQFSAATSSLFSNSLTDLNIAMQGCLVLNNTTVNSDGSYSLPEGTDKSWFTSKKNEAAIKNTPAYVVANMPKNMTPKETENWLIENFKKFGPDFLDYLKDGHELAEAGISFRNGRTFLNGIAISQDSLGRLKWGNKFLFKPTKNGGFTYSWGKRFKSQSGIDLADFHYSKLPDGSINYTELKVAGFEGFKDAVNPINDFKGWKDASKIGKLGKGLGILGTGMTIGTNFADNIDLSDGLGVGETVNFVTDTAIDVGSGAGATAIGAVAGSAFLPPVGTVVGAGVGVGVNILINKKFGDPPKSAVNHVKDGVKSVTKKNR